MRAPLRSRQNLKYGQLSKFTRDAVAVTARAATCRGGCGYCGCGGRASSVPSSRLPPPPPPPLADTDNWQEARVGRLERGERLWSTSRNNGITARPGSVMVDGGGVVVVMVLVLETAAALRRGNNRRC